MATHKLAILVEAIGTAKAAKNLKGVDAVVSKIGARAGKGIRTAADNLRDLGVGAAGLAAAGLVGAIKVAGDFEAQLNTINTVAGLTPEKLAEVGSGIRALARDTGGSLTDLTGAYYDLVSAGIKPGADAMKVLTLANTLAIGGLATTGQTVDLLTTAINTYGLNAAGAAKATDQFAEAIALGKVTASQIAESFAIVGPLAQSMGIGIDEISAAYAQLTARGVPAAEAMTQMRSAMVSLQKPTASLNKAQKTTGINFAKLAKEKGLQVAMQKLVDYSKKTGTPLAKLLGRIEGVNYALAVTGENADDYNAALKKVQSATGTAADQMSERQKGLNYQLGRLKALAIDAGVTIGSKLLPKLTPLAERAAKFLDEHQDEIGKFGDSIASAFDKAASFASKVPWDTIGSGLKTAAEWSGRLMDVFLGMPKDVQTTLVALAGLNKLSGGAISGIVGELGKGLIKGVLGMNAGVVNLNAGVVNGAGGAGGGPVPVGAGGKAGAVGTTLKVIQGALIVTSVAAIADAVKQPLIDAARQIHDEWKLPDLKLPIPQSWPWGPKNTPTILPDVFGGNGLLGGTPGEFTNRTGLKNNPVDPGMAGWAAGRGKWLSEAVAQNEFRDMRREIVDVGTKTDSAKDATSRVGDATRSAGRTTSQGLGNVASVTRSGTSGTTAATNTGASRIVGAIAANRPVVTTTVNVNVTAAQVQKSTATQTRYGSGNGSAGKGGHAGGQSYYD